MIVLDLKVDNFYAFKDFHVNFSYPKKIVGSYIESEHLEGRSNFRYKKVNIIMGANATGKTTLGSMFMDIFNLIDKKNYSYLLDSICDKKKSATFTIEIASDTNKMYRVHCVIAAKKQLEYKYTAEDLSIHVDVVDILTNDSYEICARKLDEMADYKRKTSFQDELDKIEQLYWLFESPLDFYDEYSVPGKDSLFLNILDKVMRALDPAIKSVTKVPNIDAAYAITINNMKIILQNGVKLDTQYLSSGTLAGIGVSRVLYSIMRGKNKFYYCDEKFSYIHSEIEKAILAVMIEKIRPNEQLFFTTHNTEILEMNLPKHSFLFMKKSQYDDESYIECISASSLLKRNTDSLKKAVENDLFGTAPSTELIYEIEELA
ncbi:ATPase/GTPase, AAA15 family [Butyrivibrio fibrisolvens]|uniref:ATPase/GTPase, AAA15 family n=1 Tax=Butyrivibrio fibrisolvens TaxID=831 RepID=A0A1H9XAI6_BUTFI|nr:ATP-binding protein [Butyrivibrio fibrisolvens]SES43142.1 ATPase/GTPase, AAA15 family [Butyrivibrio fibrisolvens]